MLIMRGGVWFRVPRMVSVDDPANAVSDGIVRAMFGAWFESMKRELCRGMA